MSYWVIRAGARSIEVDVAKRVCLIFSRRRPRIAARDVLVLLKLTSAGESFTSWATVTRVEIGDATEANGVRETRVETGEWESLAEDSTVKLLQYSLTIIHNLRHPRNHFRAGYRRLPREDFETIKSGEVFVGRTTYFELLGALPEDMRNQFHAWELVSAPFELGQLSFETRLRHLNDFISTRVLAAGTLLQRITHLISSLELHDERGRSYSHQFCDENESKLPASNARGDDVQIQAASFRELIAALGQLDAVHEEAQSVERDAVGALVAEIATRERLPREREFELLFRGNRDDL